MSRIQHTERTHHSIPSSQYVLPSDELERQRYVTTVSICPYQRYYSRLKLQHEVIRRAFGGALLFPCVRLSGNDQVLDSGTGTGIWLLELAPQLPPTVRLHGVDIITRLFPTTYPSNIKFSVEDVTRLPSSWSNSFTLVHQRLLLAALRKVEWPIAISEMYRVISPGGWIQLCETGSWRAGPFTARFQSLMRTLLDSKGLFMDCYKAMPLMLRNAGFVDVRVEVIQLSLCGAEGSDDRKNMCNVFRGMKTPILNVGGFGFVSSEAEFDALVNGVEDEMEKTASAQKEYFLFCARKPSL
ncbi:S-adenosyl-L-methionine-dependent methyltransferase [Armillaria solidipes]|uniref:S-adenosyl-L-methionine-dependent methyltransferase n=1 Tax=Armillaria solidipes TaxID=1076256 RepID=A0A2H3C3Q5_9AGAR|nr:S-adenosyl-L-methionine-dependent methyltransferase [Armillaria solidipes]